jgi:chorismate mutase
VAALSLADVSSHTPRAQLDEMLTCTIFEAATEVIHASIHVNISEDVASAAVRKLQRVEELAQALLQQVCVCVCLCVCVCVCVCVSKQHQMLTVSTRVST